MSNLWLSATEKITATTGVIDVGANNFKTTLITLATGTTIANSSGDIVHTVASGKKNSFVVDSTEEFVINADGGANPA